MEKFKKYIPYIILLAGSIILLIRAFYSFCWSDETFYSATAYRFMCGDRMFIDDWFPTQLSGFILLPFISLFKLVTGSMDGIILFLRIMYVILSFAAESVIFHVLNKDRNSYIAYAASLMMLFFVNLNIATLSYYSISVQCFAVAMILIYHFTFVYKKSLLIASGVIFAISVLALPTMTVAYALVIVLLATLCFIAYGLKKEGLREKLNCLQMKNIILYSFIGISAMALIFLIFLFSNVSLGDMIKGIPYVLSDEEHGTGLIFPLRKFFISINAEFHKGAYLFYLMLLLCLLLRRKLMKPGMRLLVFAFDVILFMINALYAWGSTGYIQTALCMFALPLYILTNKRDKKLFYTDFLGGLVFSLVYSYSSNGFLYVLSMGHAIAGIAGFAFIYDFCEEIRQEENVKLQMKNVVKMISVAVVSFCLLTTMYLRIVNVYRDAPLSELTETINMGPARGLKTTALHAKLYENVYSTIQSECNKTALGIDESEDGYIFITKVLPFGYMCTDLRVAAPTCWRTSFDSERLGEFYELNPDKLPDVVLMLDEEYGTFDACGDVEYDPNPNANQVGGFLKEYLDSEGFICKDVPCGVIYRR